MAPTGTIGTSQGNNISIADRVQTSRIFAAHLSRIESKDTAMTTSAAHKPAVQKKIEFAGIGTLPDNSWK